LAYYLDKTTLTSIRVDVNITTLQCRIVLHVINSLNMFYCSKWQKDKTQVKQLRQSSPINMPKYYSGNMPKYYSTKYHYRNLHEV
jgi:hypothetical protein